MGAFYIKRAAKAQCTLFAIIGFGAESLVRKCKAEFAEAELGPWV